MLRFAGARFFSRDARKQPLDAVWRAAVRAAVERVRGSSTVALFGEIRRCFEAVGWALLRSELFAAGFPDPTLRLFLAAYRWEGVIALGRA